MILCELCQKAPAILEAGVKINRDDQEYFSLCKECLRLRFSFVRRWNIDSQEWQFLKV